MNDEDDAMKVTEVLPTQSHHCINFTIWKAYFRVNINSVLSIDIEFEDSVL